MFSGLLARITGDDYAGAVETLGRRFVWLLANHGEGRKPTPGEVAGALAWGEARAASMTDGQAADEIGGPVDGFAVQDLRPDFGRTCESSKAADAETQPTGGPFTLAEVERVCGTEAADSARGMIERHNADLWNRQQAGDPEVRNAAPHNYLVMASELADAGFGEQLGQMVVAGPDEVSAGWGAVRSARLIHPGGSNDRNPVSKRWRTLDELAQTPAPEWLIKNLMIRGAAARLTAPPESLKTFVALDAALAVATGEPFAASGRYATGQRAHVLYVVGEGLGSFHSRVEAWRIARGVSREAITDVFTVLAGAVQFADERDMADVIAKVTETGAVMVIFDTQARCTVGLEENSATAQGLAVRGLDTLREATGATVLVLHHPNKGNDRDPRGSSAWNGALDTELHLERDGMDLTLTVTKMKDAETGHVCPLRAAKVDVPGDPRGSLALEARDPMTADNADVYLLPFDEMTGHGKLFVKEIYELVQATTVPGVGLTISQIRVSASEKVEVDRQRDGKLKTRRRVCSSASAARACVLLEKHGWLVKTRVIPGLGHSFYEPKDYPEGNPADVAVLAEDNSAVPSAT